MRKLRFRKIKTVAQITQLESGKSVFKPCSHSQALLKATVTKTQSPGNVHFF